MIGVIGAVDALTRALAIELSPLRVNIVSPGVVDTEVGLLNFLYSQLLTVISC